MQALWNTIFYQPIYNALIFLINHVTLGDVGFAIIILTIIVKFILFPLTKKSITSQILMKKLEPELKAFLHRQVAVLLEVMAERPGRVGIGGME